MYEFGDGNWVCGLAGWSWGGVVVGEEVVCLGESEVKVRGVLGGEGAAFGGTGNGWAFFFEGWKTNTVVHIFLELFSFFFFPPPLLYLAFSLMHTYTRVIYGTHLSSQAKLYFI